MGFGENPNKVNNIVEPNVSLFLDWYKNALHENEHLFRDEGAGIFKVYSKPNSNTVNPNIYRPISVFNFISKSWQNVPWKGLIPSDMTFMSSLRQGISIAIYDLCPKKVTYFISFGGQCQNYNSVFLGYQITLFIKMSSMRQGCLFHFSTNIPNSFRIKHHLWESKQCHRVFLGKFYSIIVLLFFIYTFYQFWWFWSILWSNKYHSHVMDIMAEWDDH